jgi:hypothetical protein
MGGMDQQLGDFANDDAAIAHRERAKAELDQIARGVREALAAEAIHLPVFFMIPNSGDSILTFGTPGDPPDDEWWRVSEIVSAIVRQTVGLDRTRCQEIICATTDSFAAPMHMASLQHSGTEFR